MVILVQNIQTITQGLIINGYIKTVVKKPAIIWSLIAYKQKVIGAESHKGLDTRKIIFKGMTTGIFKEINRGS